MKKRVREINNCAVRANLWHRITLECKAIPFSDAQLAPPSPLQLRLNARMCRFCCLLTIKSIEIVVNCELAVHSSVTRKLHLRRL